MKKNASILVLFALIFWACSSKEELGPITMTTCEDEAYLGLFEFSATSGAFFPFPETLQSITMVDADGDEVEFVTKINTRADNKSFFAWDRICTLDSTVSYRPYMDTKTYTLEIDNDLLDLKLNIQLSTTYVGIEENDPIQILDIMSLAAFTPIDTSFVNTSFSIFTDIRNSTLTLGTPTYDTFELNGKTFSDVYTNESEMKDYTIYYNTTYGIVGIVSTVFDVQLAFDKYN